MRIRISELAASVRSFWRDTEGVMLPYVTVLLVVFVGMSVLALDGGRARSLHTQLQKGADALARAGAAELDRLPNSIDRATAAVNNLITNSSIFGTAGNQNVSAVQIRFMSTLPASDVSPITNVLCTAPGCTAAQAVLASYIEVTVTPTTMSTILPASFFGGTNSITAGATAVAGMDQVACQFSPMFMCNPFEQPGMTYDQATAALYAAVADPAVRKRLIKLRQQSGSGSYVDGNWGFLQFPGAPGAAALKDALAVAHPPTCFRQNAVTTETGFIASARDAINVRFDIYNGSSSSLKNDPDYNPAMNVRKGYNGNTCGSTAVSQPSMQARPLTDDLCFGSGNCPYMLGRMGDGNWDFDGYWTVNHPGKPKPMVNGAPASNSNVPSRYDVYRYEIDQGLIADTSPIGENGVAQCSSSPTNDNPDRRILNIAVINCNSNLPPALPLGGGNQTDVPIAAFARMFLTKPVDGAQDDISAEILALAAPGTPKTFFDQVQLYR